MYLCSTVKCKHALGPPSPSACLGLSSGSTFNWSSKDIPDGVKARSCKASGREDTAGSLLYPSKTSYEEGGQKEKERTNRAAGREDTAGSILYPSNAYYEREEGGERDPYRRNNSSKEVGGTVDRNYDWSKMDKGKAYGVPTPHDNSGMQVRDAMNWGQN